LFSAKKLAGRLPAGGGTIIVRLIDALALSVPDVPFTEIVELPAAAEPLTVRVNVLVEVVAAGLNAAVTPAGNPVAARFTDPEKPPAAAIAIDVDPLAPSCSVTFAGVDERLKLWVPCDGAEAALAPPPQELPSVRTAAKTTSKKITRAVFGNRVVRDLNVPASPGITAKWFTTKFIDKPQTGMLSGYIGTRPANRAVS